MCRLPAGTQCGKESPGGVEDSFRRVVALGAWEERREGGILEGKGSVTTLRGRMCLQRLGRRAHAAMSRAQWMGSD